MVEGLRARRTESATCRRTADGALWGGPSAHFMDVAREGPRRRRRCAGDTQEPLRCEPREHHREQAVAPATADDAGAAHARAGATPVLAVMATVVLAEMLPVALPHHGRALRRSFVPLFACEAASVAGFNVCASESAALDPSNDRF